MTLHDYYKIEVVRNVVREPKCYDCVNIRLPLNTIVEIPSKYVIKNDHIGGILFLNCSGKIIDRFLDRLYLTMARLFELNQRYQEINHNSETLLDMTGVFTSLSHAHRSARPEWIMIILIAIEIVLCVMGIIHT